MTTHDTSSIHRYLDAAFAQVAASPDAQDLKEEIRGNLMARVAELEAGGATGSAASARAIKELGDLREVLAPLGEIMPGAATAAPTREGVAHAYLRNKVRPKPAYAVRAVLESVIAVAGATAVTLAALGVFALTTTAQAVVAGLALALPVGFLTADGLRQETSQSYPLPRGRAFWYGVSVALATGGLAFGAVFWGDHSAPWPVLMAVVLVVAACLAFTYLGVTQTNRKKPWAKAMGDAYLEREVGAGVDGSVTDPAVEARFGIYSGALWIVALGAFVALSIAIGFTWSWLALFGALVLQMVMLGRMLFPPGLRRP
jgi:hypothetical protein